MNYYYLFISFFKRILLLYVDMENPDEDILLQINCMALR